MNVAHTHKWIPYGKSGRVVYCDDCRIVRTKEELRATIMNVDEIIRSLRKKPTEWSQWGGCIVDISNGVWQLFPHDLRIVYTMYGEKSKHTTLIDRLRLRWAIWRWRKLQNAERT